MGIGGGLTVEELMERRQMLREWAEEGLSISQIADKLGITEKSVRSSLKTHGIQTKGQIECEQRRLGRST